MYNCGESDHPNDWTCEATMGHSKKLNPITVFDTDYENYEIYYSCWDFYGFFSADNLAIASRQTTMDDETQQKVRDIVEKKLPHYKMDYGMHWTKQAEKGNCVYDWHFSKD